MVKRPLSIGRQCIRLIAGRMMEGTGKGLNCYLPTTQDVRLLHQTILCLQRASGILEGDRFLLSPSRSRAGQFWLQCSFQPLGK